MEISKAKVAILVANGFEQSELSYPKETLEKYKINVNIVSPEKNSVKGWKHTEWGDSFRVDINLENSNPDDYDLLILPGGVINPDSLRINDQAIEFIKAFIDNDKPIAAICHGLWPLINANGVNNKTLTSWLSIKLDLINAGAKWVDKNVVRDGMLITSRKPDDLNAFSQEIIKILKEI